MPPTEIENPVLDFTGKHKGLITAKTTSKRNEVGAVAGLSLGAYYEATPSRPSATGQQQTYGSMEKSQESRNKWYTSGQLVSDKGAVIILRGENGPSTSGGTTESPHAKK